MTFWDAPELIEVSPELCRVIRKNNTVEVNCDMSRDDNDTRIAMMIWDDSDELE